MEALQGFSKRRDRQGALIPMERGVTRRCLLPMPTSIDGKNSRRRYKTLCRKYGGEKSFIAEKNTFLFEGGPKEFSRD